MVLFKNSQTSAFFYMQFIIYLDFSMFHLASKSKYTTKPWFLKGILEYCYTSHIIFI